MYIYTMHGRGGVSRKAATKARRMQILAQSRYLSFVGQVGLGGLVSVLAFPSVGMVHVSETMLGLIHQIVALGSIQLVMLPATVKRV